MPFCRLRKPAVFACIAMLAAQVVVATEPRVRHREQTSPSGFLDIALVAGGTLQGTLVDPQGTRLKQRTVIISQRRPVAETRSDALGNFRLSGLRGGTYVVAVDGGWQACRFWAPGTAPPCALDQLLIVGGNDTMRGQSGGLAARQWLTENGGQIALIGAFIALPIVYATKPYGS